MVSTLLCIHLLLITAVFTVIGAKWARWKPRRLANPLLLVGVWRDIGDVPAWGRCGLAPTRLSASLPPNGRNYRLPQARPCQPGCVTLNRGGKARVRNGGLNNEMIRIFLLFVTVVTVCDVTTVEEDATKWLQQFEPVRFNTWFPTNKKNTDKSQKLKIMCKPYVTDRFIARICFH